MVVVAQIAAGPGAHAAADLVLGLSSLRTPFFFAACLGAIASGRLAFDQMSVAFGLVSLAATAFSGASFLVGDARRYGFDDLVAYFRRRAILAGFVLITIGTLALGAIGLEAPALLWSMLAGVGLPFFPAALNLPPPGIVLLLRPRYVLDCRR